MEERVFGKEAEFVDTINTMVASDIWREHYANEVSIKEIPNAPIAVDSIMKDNEIEPSLSEQVREAMETTKAIAKTPGGNKWVTYPINLEAFPSLQDRAGLYGKTVKVVPEVLNTGLELNEDKAKLLVRDGMLCADHSSKYVVLEQDQLIRIFIEEVDKLGFKKEFAFGRISTSFTDCIYSIETGSQPVSSRGIDTQYAVRFTTSDTSKSGANVGCGLLFTHNGKKFFQPFGKTIKLKHDGDANFTQFRHNCTLLLSLLREQSQKLDELKKREIKHPMECFENLVVQQNLPRKEAKVILDDFLIRCGAKVTALDLYLNLANIIGLVQEKGGFEKALDIQENISRIVFFDNAIWNKMDAKHTIL